MPGEPAPLDLPNLSVDELRRAAAVYLAIAYPSGEPPESARRKLDWPEGAMASAIVAARPFERASRPGSPAVFALRLGNAAYPHMKLQVQPWDSPAGYMLSVNTHDQVAGLTDDMPDAAAFRALQAENARLKEAIEAAWDEAGLPTFLRYLRDYLGAQGGGPAA